MDEKQCYAVDSMDEKHCYAIDSLPASPATDHGSFERDPNPLLPGADSSGCRERIWQVWRQRAKETWTGPSGVSRPWKQTFFRFGPLSGLFCMLLAAVAPVASLGVLAGSNGQKVQDWPVPPSAYIAIFTAISNASIRYAAFQGVLISWWIKASSSSTYARLHLDWRAGTMIRGAVMAGSNMGLLGLACIFSTLVVIDGPLLQRASTVVTVDNFGSIPLRVSMVPEIPHLYSGQWGLVDELKTTRFFFSNAFNETVPTGDGGTMPNNIWTAIEPQVAAELDEYWNEEPLYGVVQGCTSACQAVIHAPALFPTLCRTYNERVDPWVSYNVSAALDGYIAPPLGSQALLISPGLLMRDHEAVNLITGVATYDNEHCTGTLSYQACILESGIGEYDVQIANDYVLMGSLTSPRRIAIANNTATERGLFKSYKWHNSTLAGIVNVMEIKWGTSCPYSPDGLEFDFYFNSGQGIELFETATERSYKCPSYAIPHESVMNDFNRLMFLLGAAAARQNIHDLASRLDPGLVVESTVVGKLRGSASVFHTSYYFFIGAAAINLVSLLFVAATYKAWWQVGRSFSFSPLEIAKAFRSPLLSDCNSNFMGNELAVALGERQITYGVIRGERSELGFGEPASIHPPRNGMMFDR